MTEFECQLEDLSARSKKAERQAKTEEATKTSVVLPFLRVLGFDIFSLEEVIPEYVADVGVKKGEKVDLAVKMGGKVVFLIETKPIGTPLRDTQVSQLYRYFSVTESRLAILTNGREAWFFSDTEAPNRMDEKPFFIFDFQKYEKNHIEELARFRKENFTLESVIEAASNLKYRQAAASYLKRQIENPDDDFVRLVGKKIYKGSLTKFVLEQLRPSIQSSLDNLVRERIQDKLRITLRDNEPSSPSVDEPVLPSDTGNGIVTTEEELLGYRIIQAIGSGIVPIERINIRDSKTYCAILMDNNNRRPICRLYFNSPKTKNVVIFDPEKKESKYRVKHPTDLYRHKEAIELILRSYA